MSVDISVIGIVEETAEFKKMRAAYEACEDAGVEIPKAVREFFKGKSPEEFTEVNLSKIKGAVSIKDYTDHVVDLKKLPPHITKVKFHISY